MPPEILYRSAKLSHSCSNWAAPTFSSQMSLTQRSPRTDSTILSGRGWSAALHPWRLAGYNLR